MISLKFYQYMKVLKTRLKRANTAKSHIDKLKLIKLKHKTY